MFWPQIGHSVYITMTDWIEWAGNQGDLLQTKLFKLLQAKSFLAFYRNGPNCPSGKNKMGEPIGIGHERLLLQANTSTAYIKDKSRPCYMHLRHLLHHIIRYIPLSATRKRQKIPEQILGNPLHPPWSEPLQNNGLSLEFKWAGPTKQCTTKWETASWLVWTPMDWDVSLKPENVYNTKISLLTAIKLFSFVLQISSCGLITFKSPSEPLNDAKKTIAPHALKERLYHPVTVMPEKTDGKLTSAQRKYKRSSHMQLQGWNIG